MGLFRPQLIEQRYKKQIVVLQGVGKPGLKAEDGQAIHRFPFIKIILQNIKLEGHGRALAHPGIHPGAVGFQQGAVSG